MVTPVARKLPAASPVLRRRQPPGIQRDRPSVSFVSRSRSAGCIRAVSLWLQSLKTPVGSEPAALPVEDGSDHRAHKAGVALGVCETATRASRNQGRNQRRRSRAGSRRAPSLSFHLRNVSISPDTLSFMKISSSSCDDIMMNIAEFLVRPANLWAALCSRIELRSHQPRNQRNNFTINSVMK